MQNDRCQNIVKLCGLMIQLCMQAKLKENSSFDVNF